MPVAAQRNVSKLMQRIVKSRLKLSRLGNQSERKSLESVINKFVKTDDLQNMPKLIQTVLDEVYGVEATIEESTYLLLEAILLHD